MAAAKASFARILSRAFNGGCEVSLVQLMDLVEFESTDVFDRQIELRQFISDADLVLRPPIEQGGPDDIRVLISPAGDGFADTLRSHFDIGEQSAVEYKSTLLVSLDMHRKRGFPLEECLDEAVIHSTLKTICAFLNRGGGEIYIGVEPNHSICGIELDFSVLSPRLRDYDGWANRLIELVKARFHEPAQILSYLNLSVERIDGLLVCRLVVSGRTRLSFVKDPAGTFRCYQRTGPRVEEVGIQDIPDLIGSR